MFGELVGACLADCWQRAGAPADALYAELGPGRGTLAADALRVMRKAGLRAARRIWSRPARAAPSPGANGCRARIGTTRSTDLPPTRRCCSSPTNSSMPCRSASGSAARSGGSRSTATACASPRRRDRRRIRRRATRRPRRSRAHLAQPWRRRADHRLRPCARARRATRCRRCSGTRFADPLADPGEQDLTAHVDFEALAQRRQRTGATVSGPVGQGDWLRAAGHRPARAKPDCQQPGQARTRSSAARRPALTGRTQMGELFKVMALRAPGWPEPAGFAA